MKNLTKLLALVMALCMMMSIVPAMADATPSPDVSVDPSPDVSVDPSPDVSEPNPSPDVSVDPSPDVGVDPSPDVSVDPSPDVSVDPSITADDVVVSGPATQAFLMYADAAWVNQVWNPGEQPAGMVVTEATITGEGDYTVGLDFTGTADGAAAGLAFAALGIADGENLYPGWKIAINEIRVNGEAIEVDKGYTSSDDGIVTRMNIFNEWVAELPADARSYDGYVDNANWVIVDKADFESVKTVEVDFSFMKYGVDTAYIMYADSTWERQYWLDGNDYGGVTVTNATVTGPGDYTVGLDFTTTEYGKAEGVAFAALGIKYGENTFPGMMIKINDIRVNGDSIAFTKGYTSSDDKIETRMNIYNEWVAAVPENDASVRSWDGTTEDAAPIMVAKDDLATVETIEIDFSLIPVTDKAFLMFADTNWATQAWNPGEYAETNAVEVDGPGTYTLAVEFPEALPGFAFLAAGIATGEQTFPGYYMDITSVKVNGAEIEIAKDFTTTDEGITTRANIWNEWVTELPAQARIADGNLEGATAMIATKEALSNVTSLEVTFDYIYGEPAAAEGPAPLTEDEVAAMIAADYNGYVAVQSENYIFRNDWEEPSYGRDAENGAHKILGFIESDGSITDKGATFVDAAITGNGTYTVSMTVGEPGFGTDTFFRYFRVATDIPAQLVKEGYVTISDVTVKFGDAKTQEGLTVWTDGDWVKLVVVDEYNGVEAPFGYTVPAPGTTVTFTFTVSGLAD
ncbi:MAG: hypothetical protein IJ438_02655 [Clostridia bacterium]|nr:hypothetical protein [Clostridia bacterium]